MARLSVPGAVGAVRMMGAGGLRVEGVERGAGVCGGVGGEGGEGGEENRQP
jgi:hypothetical protein